MSELKTGGQIIWECLIHEGVEVVFGLPGGTILPTYDDLYKHSYPVHHVLVTHEHDVAEFAKRIVLFRDGHVVEDKPNAPRDAAAVLAATPGVAA